MINGLRIQHHEVRGHELLHLRMLTGPLTNPLFTQHYKPRNRGRLLDAYMLSRRRPGLYPGLAHDLKSLLDHLLPVGSVSILAFGRGGWYVQCCMHW
jgi:hypothetical protein